MFQQTAWVHSKAAEIQTGLTVGLYNYIFLNLRECTIHIFDYFESECLSTSNLQICLHVIWKLWSIWWANCPAGTLIMLAPGQLCRGMGQNNHVGTSSLLLPRPFQYIWCSPQTMDVLMSWDACGLQGKGALTREEQFRDSERCSGDTKGSQAKAACPNRSWQEPTGWKSSQNSYWRKSKDISILVKVSKSEVPDVKCTSVTKVSAKVHYTHI